MIRAKLVAEDVLYVVVGSTMTTPEESGIEKELEHANTTNLKDLGMHYYVDSNAVVTQPVEPTERGNRLARYQSNSIVIIAEGGYDETGEPSTASYTQAQLDAIKATCDSMLRTYPNARLTLWHELRKGINPVLSTEAIS